MDLKFYNVIELSLDETIQINGGGKLSDFFAAVWDKIKDAYEWVKDQIIGWISEQYHEYLRNNVVGID